MMRKLLAATGLALALSLSSPSVLAGDKTPDQILAAYEAAKPPVFDQARKDDMSYRQEYSAKMMESMNQRAELAKAMWDADPTHPRAIEMMKARWNHLAQTGKADQVLAEVDTVLAAAPADKKQDLEFTRAMLEMRTAAQRPGSGASLLPVAEKYITAYPTDPRGGDLLSIAAGRAQDSGQQLELYRRIVKDFPEARAAAGAKGKLRQAEGVGKPFELSFNDAVTGKTITSADLKGKVVVVDFWATWCGPCIAEMPHMKEIYAKYKDKGVEFIGISLDNPGDGLDKLKDYVAKNQVGWPQYYQGKGWDSEFSKSWGINSIPALFVVDQQGNLYSTNARGQVEKLIEELLSKVEKTG